MFMRMTILLAAFICGTTQSWADTTKQQIFLTMNQSTNFEKGSNMEVMFLYGITTALTKEGWFVYFSPDLVRNASEFATRRGWPDKYLKAVLKQSTLRPKGVPVSDYEGRTVANTLWIPLRDNPSCEIAKPSDKGNIPQLILDFQWQDTTMHMTSTYRGMSGPSLPIKGSLPLIKAVFNDGSKTLLSDEFMVTGSAVDSRVQKETRGDIRGDVGWSKVYVYCDHFIEIIHKYNVKPSGR